MGRYKMVYRPDHPRANKNGYVENRILIAENILGRYLNNDEVIWQKNVNPRDDRKENLLIFNNRFERSNVFNNRVNNRVFYICKICKKEIFGKSKLNICKDCYKQISHSTKRPPKIELENALYHKSILSIGNIYGVSDNTIRKWLKYYNLPYSKKEIELWRRD